MADETLSNFAEFQHVWRCNAVLNIDLLHSTNRWQWPIAKGKDFFWDNFNEFHLISICTNYDLHFIGCTHQNISVRGEHSHWTIWHLVCKCTNRFIIYPSHNEMLRLLVTQIFASAETDIACDLYVFNEKKIIESLQWVWVWVSWFSYCVWVTSRTEPSKYFLQHIDMLSIVQRLQRCIHSTNNYYRLRINLDWFIHCITLICWMDNELINYMCQC